MKIDTIYATLQKILTSSNISVRSANLSQSNGGYCMLNNNKIIVVNKTQPVQMKARMLARCINELDLLNADVPVEPKIREYIENEFSLTTSVEYAICIA